MLRDGVERVLGRATNAISSCFAGSSRAGRTLHAVRQSRPATMLEPLAERGVSHAQELRRALDVAGLPECNEG